MINNTISVLVVDDQFLIRAGLVSLLRAAPGIEVAGEAADGEEAVALAARARPDVVVMDIRLPRLDGIGATRRILADARDPAPRVLVLTTFDRDEYICAALRAGACGFLLKDVGPQRLIGAVTAVARGGTLFSPGVTRRLVEAYVRSGSYGGVPGQRDKASPGEGRQHGRTRAPGSPEAGARAAASAAGRLAALTAREREVLRLTARGLSNTEMAALLFISEATVKTHLNHTMSKLDLDTRAQAVVLAYETGLVTPGYTGRAGPGARGGPPSGSGRSGGPPCASAV